MTKQSAEKRDDDGGIALTDGAADVAAVRGVQSVKTLESLPSGCDIDLLSCGTFRFQTLDAARQLASMLSNACPEPAKVIVGMTELMVNAVEHGNLEISYDEKTRLYETDSWEQELRRRLSATPYSDRYVEVRFERSPQRIQVTITDQGKGFDWRQFLEIDPERMLHRHGRGIAMSRLISFDFVEYRGRGNEVSVGIDLVNAE